jgi:hypothetical protein
MDFIERLFHISPDGGNGMTELLLAVLLAAALAARLVRELFAKRAAQRSRRAA